MADVYKQALARLRAAIEDPHGSEFHDAADFVDEVIALSEEIGHSSKLRALRDAFLQTVEDKLSCHAWNVPLKERRKQLSHIALTVRYSKADIEHLHPVDQPVHYSYKIGVMMGDAKEKTTFLYDAQYDGSTERACFTVNAVAGADDVSSAPGAVTLIDGNTGEGPVTSNLKWLRERFNLGTSDISDQVLSDFVYRLTDPRPAGALFDVEWLLPSG